MNEKNGKPAFRRKKTVAGKLSLRLFLLLLLALVILFVSSYISVSHMIRSESEHYSRVIVSIYGDVLLSESSQMNFPLNVSYAEEARFYGEYICSWYRVDYIYSYIPHPENNTIEYISMSKKAERFPDSHDENYAGRIEEHVFTRQELDVINGAEVYASIDNDTFEDAVDIISKVTDNFGNTVCVGAAVSVDDLEETIRQDFHIITSIIVSVFLLLTVFMYLLIRRMVSRPARKLSESMTAFITDGKRVSVHMNENGDDEFAMIAQAFNSMSDDIDAYTESIRSLSHEQERRNAELDVASKIQQGFLPPNHALFDDCSIDAMMLPARDVGGDLYDYLRLDDHRTLVVIGDISGKGISACMFMAVTLTLIRQFARLGQSPAEILAHVNERLSERNPGMLFATVFIGIFDSETKTLLYANGGHNPPCVFSDRVIMTNETPDILLGFYPEETYTNRSLTLHTGDVLFLYTDGVNEAVDADRTFYGMERLAETLSRAKRAHDVDLVRAVNNSLQSFCGNAEQHDDITMLTLTVREKVELDLLPQEREFLRIRDVILDSDFPRETLLELCAAAEECFANICFYAYEGRDKTGETVHFTLERSDYLVMRFADGGIPYDPRADFSADVGEEYDPDTQIGGLGKLIAFTVADSVDYEYKDGKNLLSITKYMKDRKED